MNKLEYIENINSILEDLYSVKEYLDYCKDKYIKSLDLINTKFGEITEEYDEVSARIEFYEYLKEDLEKQDVI